MARHLLALVVGEALAQRCGDRVELELWTCGEIGLLCASPMNGTTIRATGFRAYVNVNWEFDERGLMARRFAFISDLPIRSTERRYRWPLGTTAIPACPSSAFEASSESTGWTNGPRGGCDAACCRVRAQRHGAEEIQQCIGGLPINGGAMRFSTAVGRKAWARADRAAFVTVTASIAATLASSSSAHAAGWCSGSLRVDAMIGSHHVHPKKLFEDVNPGLGVECWPNRQWALTMGGCRNSLSRPSWYGGGVWARPNSRIGGGCVSPSSAGLSPGTTMGSGGWP
jgi:hypothetical protein